MKWTKEIISGITAALIAAWVWWYWPYLVHMMMLRDVTPEDLAFRGQYGDSYGGLNALVTALAFAGLLCTIFMQITESRKKDFQDALFQLLDLWRDYIKELSLDEKKGGEALAAIWEEAFKAFEPLKKSRWTEKNGKTILCSAINHHYSEASKNHPEILDAYYRILYRIFRILEDTDTRYRQDYAKIVRALLTPHEICLLAFNGLTDEGEKFHRLIVKFALLKHLNNYWKELLLSSNLYPAGAFND
jgi:hypothetical protein